MNIHELKCAKKLIELCLVGGNSISVWDGEDYAIVKSTDPQAILNALASTDEDLVKVHNAAGVGLGAWYLIWGEISSPGDALGLICDHSVSDFMEGIYSQLEAFLGGNGDS